MNLLLTIALISVVIALFVSWIASRPRGAQLTPLVNIGEGTHSGSITKKTGAALASRHLIVKFGSDVDHVAAAGVSDIPLGVASDEASAAEEIVSVSLLGSAMSTLKVQAAAAIAVGDFVVAGAAGQARTLPGTTGTYYIIGRALNAAGAQGDIVEIDPCVPTQRVV